MLNPAEEALIQTKERSNKKQSKPVDKQSIKKVLSTLNKLRPIRAEIESRVKDVEGFTGIAISSGKVVVFASGQAAAKRISAAIGRRRKLVVVKPLKGTIMKHGKIVEVL